MHRNALATSACLTLLACVPGGAAATPAGQGNAPSANHADPGAARDQTLKAMKFASTWGHPDLWGEFTGMKHYAKGDYRGAMKYFKYGARFADKPSQLGIGLMYANGLGVDQDVVTGCAWLMLAAERKYPRFVATRDEICGKLTPAQHDQAVAAYQALLPEYGDQVARKRMAVQLRVAYSERTGSHVGFDAGMQAITGHPGGMTTSPNMAGAAPRNCGGDLTIDGIPWPTKNCMDHTFWAADRWDPKVYFAARDAHWLGTVSVGNLQNVDTTGQDSGTHPAPAASSGH